MNTNRNLLVCSMCFVGLLSSTACAQPQAGVAQEPTGDRTRQVLTVGPNQRFQAPSAAARHARDGDTIEIQAGTYPADAAVWRQNNLTIRGVDGLARLSADGVSAEGKALWVLKGNNTSVENVEFLGVRVADRNGAGIRLEGVGLTVRNSAFRGNENGILCGSNPNSDVLVEHSEFDRNGHGDGQSHNIYCGRIRSLTMRFNRIHNAKVGHNVKSRASRNFIAFNWIGDEELGDSSYGIDFPDGGLSVLLGNVIQKGQRSVNRTLISYGAEGYKHAINRLHAINNTLVSERREATRFIFVRDGALPGRVTNNLFVGSGTLLTGPGELQSNFAAKPSDFRDSSAYDFHLIDQSRHSGTGIDPGHEDGVELQPRFQYAHRAKSEVRRDHRGLTPGAFGK